MLSLKIILRPSVRGADHPGSLYLRLIHRRQIRQFSLSLSVHKRDWNPLTQKTSSPEVNHQLESILTTVREIIAKQNMQAGVCCLDDILLHYRTQTGGNSLYGFTREIASIYHRRGQERTARAYLSATSRLLAYCKIPHLPLTSITPTLIENYEKALQGEGLSHNTVSFYLRNLRTLYNKAVDMGQLSAQGQHPFSHVTTRIEPGRKRALTRKDIYSIHTLNLSQRVDLEFARRLFCFSFHARGMSFVDMAYLKKSDLKNGIITYRRKKTRQRIEIKVNEELRKLIGIFSEMTISTPYLLPIIRHRGSNTRRQYESGLRLQNKRLGILGCKAGISYPLTTHVARHTWASLAKEIHTPLAVISESLGHSNQHTTYTYLCAFDRSVLDKAGEEVSRLVRIDPSQYRPATVFNS